MSGLRLEPARVPTMHFVGVTTGRSMIMKVFPLWAEALGLGRCELKGIDMPQHDAPERYREVIRFIRDDPQTLGALVTTHKIDLLRACRDLFDELDENARLMGEVSAIYKRGARLAGAAKDALTAGRALEAFVPAGHFQRTGADAFIIGAGGSSIALSSYLAARERGTDRPARMFVSNRSPGRLTEIRRVHEAQGLDVPVEYVHTPQASQNDSIVARLRPGSLLANATGLGKDAPGSPLTDAAVFPMDGYAWDFNYRGDLGFLVQARRQEAERRLRIEDGWLYFIHGWLAVIEEVFHRDIPKSGPRFQELCRIAESQRQ
jgi:shikimate 5-dehydrogenase